MSNEHIYENQDLLKKIKEMHPDIDEQSDMFQKLAKAYVVLAEQFVNALTDYDDTIRRNSRSLSDSGVLDIKEIAPSENNPNPKNYFSYEPYFDYSDKNNIWENAGDNVYQDVLNALEYLRNEAVNQIMKNRDNPENIEPLSLSDIKEATLRTLWEREEKFSDNEYHYLTSLETRAREFIEERLGSSFRYEDDEEFEKCSLANAHGEEFKETWELIENNLLNSGGFEAEENLLSIVGITHNIDVDSISIDTQEFCQTLAGATINGYITDACEEEVNSDLSSLEYLLNSRIADVLSGNLENFNGNNGFEQMTYFNERVQEIFETRDLHENGLIRILTQNGITMDTLSNFEKLQDGRLSVEQQKLISDIIGQSNEFSDYLSTMVYPVSLSYMDYVFLNVAREVAKIAENQDIDYIYKKKLDDRTEFFNPETQQPEFIDPSEWKSVLAKNNLNEIGIQLNNAVAGIWSPNSGVNGHLGLNKVNVTIPLTAVYVDRQHELNQPQLGFYGMYECDDSECVHISILNTDDLKNRMPIKNLDTKAMQEQQDYAFDITDRINNNETYTKATASITKLKAEYLDKNLAKEFTQGMTYDELTANLEKNLEYARKLDNPNKQTFKI